MYEGLALAFEFCVWRVGDGVNGFAQLLSLTSISVCVRQGPMGPCARAIHKKFTIQILTSPLAYVILITELRKEILHNE